MLENAVGMQAEYENSLQYFTFIGRVIGKAIHDSQLMDVRFTRSFYKHMLGVPVSLADMAAFDPQIHKSLQMILEHQLEDLGLDLSFTTEQKRFDPFAADGKVEKTESVPLLEGGDDIEVTEDNKAEYVKLVCEHKLTMGIKHQIDAFMKGFRDVIPEYINIFTEQELELLISGLPEVDVNDLKANCEYQGYTAASPVVLNFWRCMEGMTQSELACFIMFVTGTAKVPLDGFASLEGMSGPQKFQIHRDHGSRERLPQAHTCFNQLVLPAYCSRAQLRERLLFAVANSDGFHMT